MTRIAGVCARDAGRYVRLAYHFTRRSLARLTGREPERIIEPLQMYAHVPGLLRGYARLEQATAKLASSRQASAGASRAEGGHADALRVPHRHGLADLAPLGPQ